VNYLTFGSLYPGHSLDLIKENTPQKNIPEFFQGYDFFDGIDLRINDRLPLF